MLGDLFYWVLNMSITASLMGAVILPIRAIRAIPRRAAVFLWAVPFLRMCVPVGLDHPYSLMSFISRFISRAVTVHRPAEGISFSMTNFVMAADSYFPITYKAELLDRVFAVAALIWLVVASAMILVLGIVYLTTLHKVKRAEHMGGNIYRSEHVQSPAVYGIWKPRIVMPPSYAADHDRYILEHEATHIRHLDNLWRILALLIVCVHWFDPLAWLFLKLFLSDIELACDESTIANYGEEQKKGYALSLVDTAESRSLFLSAFGGAKIRRRVENIFSYKKMTCLSLLGSSALIVSIAAVLLTNAG